MVGVRRLFTLSTGQLVKTNTSGLKDRVHLDDLRVFLPRREGAITGQDSCVDIPWDGRRLLDGSVWAEVCLGGVICFWGLWMEDMGGMLPRGVLSLKKKGAAVGDECQEQ